MLIEFEDTKQLNNESNEASDIVISQLKTKQHELQEAISIKNAKINKLEADNEDCSNS